MVLWYFVMIIVMKLVVTLPQQDVWEFQFERGVGPLVLLSGY